MKDKMSILIQLQDCDNKIRALKNKKMQGPLKIQELEKALKAAEMKVQEENDKLETLKKERRRLEQEIQELDNKTEKSNIKLSNIKSNKEYTAALKEIDDLKKSKSLLEDDVIRIMEEIEDIGKRCAQNADIQRAMKQEFEETKKEIEKEMQDLDRGLTQLEAERSKFDQTVDQELLKKYLFLKERKGGMAVSAVIGGVCQTCHMGIPPQKYNELIRGNLLLNCPHCQRMIYWGEDGDYKKVLDDI